MAGFVSVGRIPPQARVIGASREKEESIGALGGIPVKIAAIWGWRNGLTTCQKCKTAECENCKRQAPLKRRVYRTGLAEVVTANERNEGIPSVCFHDRWSFYPLTRTPTGNHAKFFVLFPCAVCHYVIQNTMAVPSTAQITHWLVASREGNAKALESLLPLVYDELHRQAVRVFSRERAGHTLQPTALVNEVYLRLVGQHEVNWRNRAQFFAIAAQMMRRILVSHARARRAQKRGGGETRVTLDEAVAAAPQGDVNLLALDEALSRLEAIDAEKSRMVELRFFSGLSVEETAEVMGVSPRTIDRQWQTAKAWLHREIRAA
jgi:RNA polymerase sigma-70 factor (ECF subfamily)